MKNQPQKPDFDEVLQQHLDCITNRNLDVFKAHITKTETIYTIVQNGHAFKTPEEIIAVHEDWFKDPNWIWEGSVIRKVVGEDMAMALIKYDYRAKAEDKPFSTWLTYVFQLEDNEWRIIHDHNTALDFHAFAKSGE
jgi:ketosteroid isomerase-like protein